MTFEAIAESMSRALQGLSELPWIVHVVVALAMAVGLVLWLTGERMLKPLTIATCALIGGAIGFLLIPITPWGQSGSLTHWHGLLGGVFVGALAGLLMFRSAIALSSGVVFGLLLPMLAAGLLGLTRGDAPAGTTTESTAMSGMVERLENGQVGQAASAAVDRLPDSARPAAERVQGFLTSASAKADEAWSALPMVHRGIILICGAIGLAGGVIIGLSLPGWACGAVSSLFGAAIWMASFVWMSNAMGAPWREALDRPALHWLIAWSVAGVIGMGVQWSGLLARRPAKAAPAGKPATA